MKNDNVSKTLTSSNDNPKQAKMYTTLTMKSQNSQKVLENKNAIHINN